jgi:hypothetical protein
MKKNDGAGGAAIFVAPVMLSPIIVLGLAVYYFHMKMEFHPVISICIFGGLVFGFSKIISKNVYFYLGIFLSTAFCFLLSFFLLKDILWSLFITAVFGLISWWLTDLLILNDVEEIEGGFRSRMKDRVENSVQTKNAAKSNKPDRKLHKKVGFCQGWNVSSTSRASHDLYKCGNCGHAGCSDQNCPQRSFSGTNCSYCNHMANFV